MPADSSKICMKYHQASPLNIDGVTRSDMITEGIQGGNMDGDVGEGVHSPAECSRTTPRRTASIPMSDNIPLSLKIMHRPSRAQEQLDKASDPTKRNSLLNSRLHDIFNYKDDQSDFHDHEQAFPDNYGITSTNSTTSMSSLSNSPPSSSNSNPVHPGAYNLVRKKSGEIVKPSIKENYNRVIRDRRALSLPSTPTYKSVHFGGDDNVKYFKKKDKPTAISVTNSPTLDGKSYYDDYDDDDDDDNYNDDDYKDDDDDDATSTSDDETLDEYSGNFEIKKGGTKYPFPKKVKLIDWQVKLLNFPPLSYLKKIHDGIPVFLERIFITFDKKFLIGQIAVKNLSFEKYLTVRYSLDNWGTIVELPTSYEPECPDVLKSHDYDRFEFKIPLETLYNSFNSTKSQFEESAKLNKSKNTFENNYQMCIKYHTNNQEYWDNNNSKNYCIKLIKTIKDLSNNSKPLPNKLTTKNSKIQDHFEKPKYSSSYLKRRVSDSEVEKKKQREREEREELEKQKREQEDAEDAAAEQEENERNNKSNETSLFNHGNQSSDYVKNNFYLSSPLLSLYHKNDNDKDINANGKYSQEKKNNISLKSIDNINELESKNQQENRKVPNFNNSKSYKELLDNYCFFNSDRNEDDGFNENGNNINTKEKSKTVFAVSSFLEN